MKKDPIPHSEIERRIDLQEKELESLIRQEEARAASLDKERSSRFRRFMSRLLRSKKA